MDNQEKELIIDSKDIIFLKEEKESINTKTDKDLSSNKEKNSKMMYLSLLIFALVVSAGVYSDLNPPTGNLSIKTSPENASIEILNSEADYSDNMKLGAGRYKLKIKEKGYASQLLTILILPNETIAKVVKLEMPGRLSVKTNPTDAVVKILSTDIEYEDGINLDAGKYKIEVSKKDYKTIVREVTIINEKDSLEEVSLSKKTGSLLVKTDPENARVRILNIKPKYHDGIKLPVGKYKIEVSKKGYIKSLIEIEINDEGTFVEEISLCEVMKFVYIKPGTFMMGSPSSESGRDGDEKQHKVTLTKGFYMQTTEVTQGQWKRVMGNNPSYFKNCGDNCPVEKVSWNDAKEFIKKLNNKDKSFTYRLPTEAEWEYAARAGTSTPFYSGNFLSTDQANYNGSYPMHGSIKGSDRGKTIKVGSFKPNNFGLYDMDGNVFEWCEDWYHVYPPFYAIDPAGPGSGTNRVIRGGGWNDSAKYCRSADRCNCSPGNRYRSIGFRLAATSSR